MDKATIKVITNIEITDIDKLYLDRLSYVKCKRPVKEGSNFDILYPKFYTGGRDNFYEIKTQKEKVNVERSFKKELNKLGYEVLDIKYVRFEIPFFIELEDFRSLKKVWEILIKSAKYEKWHSWNANDEVIYFHDRVNYKRSNNKIKIYSLKSKAEENSLFINKKIGAVVKVELTNRNNKSISKINIKTLIDESFNTIDRILFKNIDDVYYQNLKDIKKIYIEYFKMNKFESEFYKTYRGKILSFEIIKEIIKELEPSKNNVTNKIYRAKKHFKILEEIDEINLINNFKKIEEIRKKIKKSKSKKVTKNNST